MNNLKGGLLSINMVQTKRCLTSVRAVIRDNGKVLLAQRTKNSSNGGYWEFPGGKTDCKEPKGAIKREMKEETNLKMNNIKFMKEKYDGKFYTRYYTGKVDGTVKLQKSELQGLGWFTTNQAKKLNLVNHTRRLI
jgi:8-oxo-dGTP diphosphatase